MKKYLLLLIIIISIVAIIETPAFAIPALQLYMPDATYYATNPFFPDSEDSWVTTSNPFELQVAGATSPSFVSVIDKVKLHISLREEEYLSYQHLTTTPFLTITDNDPNITFDEVVLYAGDFSTFGKPDGLSLHGIYPTYFVSIDLPNLLVVDAGETVYDYNENFDPESSEGDSGDIQYYTVSYDPRFMFIHFDLTGRYDPDGKAKDVFAPYSHDASASTPEPATMLLFGSGLLGMAAGLRKKARKKKYTA